MGRPRTTLLICASALALASCIDNARHPYVIDGDTIAIGSQRIRLADFDAPELTSPQCQGEALLAIRAKAMLKHIIAKGINLTYVPCATRNFGRACAIAKTKNGDSVAKIMIDSGLAVEYHGRGKRKDWCNG